MVRLGDTVACTNCGRKITLIKALDSSMEHCRCGAQFAAMFPDAYVISPEDIDEAIRAAEASNDFSLLSPEAVERITRTMLLTTEAFLTDCPIEKRLGIVTAECVFGMNLFRDFFASMVDIFGGRSHATQKVLRDARNVCLTELKREALLVGANGVIAVSLAYSEMSGGGKGGMIFLVAAGTAVKLRSLNV